MGRPGDRLSTVEATLAKPKGKQAVSIVDDQQGDLSPSMMIFFGQIRSDNEHSLFLSCVSAELD